MPANSEAAAVAVHANAQREAHLAIVNGAKLAGSLIVTWGFSVGIRAILPRYLGPEAFGLYSFAEALAMSFFVFATLGVESYVQKEVPVRHEHASEFFGGVLALRTLLSAFLLTTMMIVLHVTGRSPEVQLAALVFGVGQYFFVNNASFVSMLNARGRVDGMSVVNVISKVSWGVGICAAIFLKLGLWALASAFVFSEILRSVALFRLCRTHVELRLAVDVGHLKAALRRCAPFFVTTLALTLYSRFAVMLLGYLASPLELGWYSAASMVSNLGLLLIPLISGVCLPMFSRARSRSEEELTLLIRRSLEAVLLIAIPVSVGLFVGADVWIKILGGRGFEPAALSLRAIAPIFALTYLAMLSSSFLNLVNRAWTVTRASLFGIFVNAGLNVVLIRYLGPKLGPGGAGAGAATAAVLTEVFVCILLLSVIGRRAFDARLFRTLTRTALVVGAVLACNRLMLPLGPARLVIDAALYVGLALALRVIRVDEVKQLAVQLRQRRAN
ncbi:MAG: flippase [Myxococcaceae bacterium]